VRDPTASRWVFKPDWPVLPMCRALDFDEIESVFAWLRKLGYIIELPSTDYVILKPSWFAAAASITLSPPPAPTEPGVLITDPKQPGYIMRRALCKQLRGVQQWKELDWSQDDKKAAEEADLLVNLLHAIGLVLYDSGVSNRCVLLVKPFVSYLGA